MGKLQVSINVQLVENLSSKVPSFAQLCYASLLDCDACNLQPRLSFCLLWLSVW